MSISVLNSYSENKIDEELADAMYKFIKVPANFTFANNTYEDIKNIYIFGLQCYETAESELNKGKDNIAWFIPFEKYQKNKEEDFDYLIFREKIKKISIFENSIILELDNFDGRTLSIFQEFFMMLEKMKISKLTFEPGGISSSNSECDMVLLLPKGNEDENTYNRNHVYLYVTLK